MREHRGAQGEAVGRVWLAVDNSGFRVHELVQAYSFKSLLQVWELAFLCDAGLPHGVDVAGVLQRTLREHGAGSKRVTRAAMGFAYLTLGLDDFLGLEGLARVQRKENEACHAQRRIVVGLIFSSFLFF